MRAEVFAVEERSAQVVWRGGGDVAAEEVEGLSPSRQQVVALPDPDGRRQDVVISTLGPPPGRELFRFATVSDSHLGGDHFGTWPRAIDPLPDAGNVTERCLRAALDEAVAWGARMVVVKGDVTERGRPHEWDLAASLLGGAGVPVEVVPGNHDVKAGALDGAPPLAAAGVAYGTGSLRCVDVPGLRLVLLDSTRHRRHRGYVVEQQDDAVEAVADAPGAAMVVLHHYLQSFRLPTCWPPGVPRHEGDAFLDALAEANPATIVTAGHAHRCRCGRRGPVLLTETGSTRDFPGTWAGYVVHEGGIRQVVRRVAEPTAMAWTEATARSFFGAWGRWSPGRLSSRCFSHRWPARRH